MSDNAHAMIVYGIRIDKKDVPLTYKDLHLGSISSGNHVNDRTFCSFLYIEESCQNDTKYDDDSLFNVDRMKKKGWWDDCIRDFCKDKGIAFESPQWHLVAWYG